MADRSNDDDEKEEDSSESSDKMGREFTREEVSQHKTAGSCWIIIGSSVYDVTKFLEDVSATISEEYVSKQETRLGS